MVQGCESELTLLGPVGLERHVFGLRSLFTPWLEDERMRVVELADGSSTDVAGFTIDARLVHHSDHAIGVRVEVDNATLAFSGDTGPCDAVVELCRGVDLALLECSYPAGHETRSHLTAETAGQIAAEAGLQRLVLTHFYPACDAIDLEAQVRAAGYVGALHLARDGDVFDVSVRR